MQLGFNRRGDTIVEVLLCIAIAGLVITGAYGISAHALQEGISATERTEANKLAEAQIEALKFREVNSSSATWTADFANLDSASGSFCLDSQSTSETDAVHPWQIQTNAGSSNVLQAGAGNYSNKCASPQAPAALKYFIDMRASQDNSNPSSGQVYLVIVRWQVAGGGPNNQSQLYYRLPPEAP